ncbi:MAG TPA: Error-prone repair protein ImuA [Segetibacter sp.]
MESSKAHILAQLQKDILPLQGCKPLGADSGFDAGLGLIKDAFPHASFPLGAIHEFFCNGSEEVSASGGFIAGIVSAIMLKGGVAIWISSSGSIFPPALKSFGIEPDKVIFITLQKEKEVMWVMEECLKCEGLAAVIAETQEISFTASRRFQLAVEQSRVTGFIIRRNPKNLATACVTRWRITPLPSEEIDGLPGLGFPKWNVELLKVRNGTAGVWQIEWAGRFRQVLKVASIIKPQQRKAG